MTNTRNLFGAIMLAISLFFVSPVVVGGWQKTQALRTAKNERETLLADRKKILGPIITEYAKYQKMTSQGNGKLFTQLVPVNKSTPELISAIQDMANIAGVQMLEVQINTSDDTKNTSYGTISLELSLVGRYSALGTFLQSLEQYVRVLNVKSLDVTTDKKNPGQFEFAVSADTYFISRTK